MSERGSTGASSRKTTLPLSSWRSFPTIEKLSSARTIAQEMNATALRMGALFRHDDVKHQPARGEQHDTRRCQHAGFHEQTSHRARSNSWTHRTEASQFPGA